MNERLNQLRARLPQGDRLHSLLAAVVIAVIIIAYGLVGARSILPQVRNYQDTSAQVAAAERALAAAQSSQTRSPDVQRQKLATAEARRAEVARIFVSESQVADVPIRLYQYANEAGVEIASLQGQPAKKAAEVLPYDVRTIDVQIVGPLPKLMDFLSRIEEAALRGFVITNVSVASAKGSEAQQTLAMSLVLYTSPYAGGPRPTTPAVAIATPSTRAPALATSHPTTQPTAAPTPQPTKAPTLTSTPTPGPTPAPTATPTPEEIFYTVRAGDTLYSIARRYGVTVEAIQAANGMDDVIVRIGQQLYIPLP